MTSGWSIQGLELPIAPKSEKVSISKQTDLNQVYKAFPIFAKPTTSGYDYTITGILYPTALAAQLEQLAKSPDADAILVIRGADAGDGASTHGEYVFKRFEWSRDSPMYTRDSRGRTVTAYNYTMVFGEFADPGENAESIEGSTEFDEDGTGIGPYVQLGGDLGPVSSDYDWIKFPNGVFNFIFGVGS